MASTYPPPAYRSFPARRCRADHSSFRIASMPLTASEACLIFDRKSADAISDRRAGR